MKLLVIGSGGREHAICRKLLEDPQVDAVFCAKGNPGMQKDGVQLVDIAEDDHPALIQFVKENQIDWTFVGPEIPLLNGIVDDFQAAGLKIFGPNQQAAMIEGSKDFAKQLMRDYHIPTAKYQTFSDFEAAKSYVLENGAPIVIKADGLAAGKGVVVAMTEQEALEALEDMLLDHKFGASSAKVVVEEFLAGEEFSLLSFVKGNEVYPMVIAQDHKRIFDGDKGPNTGGMGAYSPVPQIPESMVQTAIKEIVQKAADGMVDRKTPFTGILYAGLIATNEGPKVIEFNARFGDPETQVVLPRLKTSLAQIIDDLLNNRQPDITWYDFATLGVVVAAPGYPADYEKNIALPEMQNTEEQTVYYAGVTAKKEQLVSSGGRVFLVTSQGTNLADAQQKAYAYLNQYDLSQFFYRKDIGFKALK
ncbi:phosphoribosylamine--glycine ligase [Enterococcus cecorum]|uniref:Phosphoribosylamine--glycine ligase n=1 Tax=Enterococcus cecorum TaxID=44008 RepID=A0AAW9JVX4_9ENTE|nr:phosphoribosylamine--glycine ligase [Enterococcus cecorum]MDZ5504115.1 phosphoribosylamine--glycine ligase [Enterococcus cecorum]MDZ5531470.1 phosphoribosylamine--glycine ligase [Enterococcus cecorum]MDZ5544684.1 phosphoribosylamine--glycine ligase [Enterococcus cecorum]MDZ5548960.1 phosphoribosylamine--glycine ligase [Enterococcus cecorum]MDZ5551173.1 phosphoribosylamine--glycine ligase [Enterococcus cecorum]